MKYVVGLMSGTSLDGIDAALVKIGDTSGIQLDLELIKFMTIDYSKSFKKELLRCCDEERGKVDKICRMNFKLGELFALAVKKIVKEANISLEEVSLIGSHGQTVYHDVFNKDFCSTLQIGSGAVIAERTGVTTVSNFRARDIAAGGEGAPLVPYVDYLLYGNQYKNIILQNIGGIGNYTYLPAGCKLKDIKASDTGPGNILIDAIISILTKERLEYDRNGEWAKKGIINDVLLEKFTSFA